MRCVRVCARHRVPLALDSLVCPASPHRVNLWLVVDAQTGELLAAATRSGIILQEDFAPDGFIPDHRCARAVPHARAA